MPNSFDSKDPNEGRIVYRGRVHGYDWALGDLTFDNNPYNLDCSAIVPAGAWMIWFGVLIGMLNPLEYFTIEWTGDITDFNVDNVVAQVATVPQTFNMWCRCDPQDRIVTYIGHGTAVAFGMLIRGWVI